MLLTGLLFVAVTGIVRHLGSDMPAVQAAFIRYVLGTLLIVPVFIRLLRRSDFCWPSRTLWHAYVWRGIVHAAAVMLWFYAMAVTSAIGIRAIA